MDIVSAVVLGIIQGLTEFLPVSSSAHLALYHNFFNTVTPDEYPGFDVMLHAATLIAVFVFYKREITGSFKSIFTLPKSLIVKKCGFKGLSDDEKLLVLLVTATVPAVIAALCGGDRLSEYIGSSAVTVGALLIVNGFLLMTADLCGGTLPLNEMRTRHAFCIGLFQAVAVVPGISRSGATLTGGLLLSFKREDAVRFSFLLSVPAVCGACVLKAPELIGSPLSLSDAAVYLCGFSAALLSGILAIKFLKFISGRSKLRYFSYYCFAIGIYAVIHGINTN